MNIKTSCYRDSLFSRKDDGIFKDTLIFDIPAIVHGQEMYFYKFDISNVVEIEFKDNIYIRSFTFSPEDCYKKIKDSAEFLADYFKSAGLLNKTFLFDTELRIPVRYNDFVKKTKLYNSRIITGFITKSGIDEYVTMPNKVYIFESMLRKAPLNAGLLAIYNSKKIIAPILQDVTPDGCLFTTILSGIAAGIKEEEFDDLIDSLATSEVKSLTYRIDKGSFKSEYPKIFSKELKTGQLTHTLYSNVNQDKEEEFNGTSINVTRLMELGFNKFIKSLKNINQTIHVNLDFPVDVKAMYIKNGAIFVVPDRKTSIDQLMEIFQTEEVFPVTN